MSDESKINPTHFVVGLFIIFFLVWSLVSHFTSNAIGWLFSSPVPASSGVMVGSSFDIFAHFLAVFITGIGAIGASVWFGVVNAVVSIARHFVTGVSEAKVRSMLREYATQDQVKASVNILDGRLRKISQDTDESIKKVVESVATIKRESEPVKAKTATKKTTSRRKA